MPTTCNVCIHYDLRSGSVSQLSCAGPRTAMLSLLVTEGMRQATLCVAGIAFAISVSNCTSCSLCESAAEAQSCISLKIQYDDNIACHTAARQQRSALGAMTLSAA